ncbi:MAG TPA: TatD family hydrolase [Thermoanaerobaculia bacterium]|nr:TatD family hydrolase [Thermoanaerobaculia bacterium]
MQPQLVDTHTHLLFGELGKDPDRYRQRAAEAGVGTLILIGIDPASSLAAAEYAAQQTGVYCAVGVHPNETAKVGADALDEIAPLLERPEVVAIGESGLDAYWDDAPATTQELWLERHVELALERDLPLVLHIRDAYPRAAELLAGPARRGLRGVIHCFGGAEHEVDPFLDWGWPISFSGILTYPEAENVRGAARRTPLDLCLVETDAPWLTPAAERGRSNEPAFVVHTARELARVKGVSFEEIAEATTANAQRVFGLPPRLRSEGLRPRPFSSVR